MEGGQGSTNGERDEGKRREHGRCSERSGRSTKQRVAFVTETMPVPTEVKVSNKHRRTAAAMLASREAVMGSIRETRAGAMERTLCENTMGGIDSAWRLWLIFCPIRGVNPDTFGQLEHDELPRPSQLMEEDQVFADFGCFAVENPGKAGLAHLQGSTAAAYISRVVARYEGILQPPRRPGVAAGMAGANNQLGHALRRTLKGLRKMHPGNKKKGRKAAVVRSMMLAVKAQLDLADPYEAMIWAYCYTCWQGGRRSGELVRGKTRTGRWDPEFDMHRGRVSNELSDDGTVQRTVIALAPDKTDVTGEEGHEALLPMSHTAEINAAEAIENMLRVDPAPCRVAAQDAPLFRDVRKGGKAMYDVRCGAACGHEAACERGNDEGGCGDALLPTGLRHVVAARGCVGLDVACRRHLGVERHARVHGRGSRWRHGTVHVGHGGGGRARATRGVGPRD